MTQEEKQLLFSLLKKADDTIVETLYNETKIKKFENLI